MTQASGEGRDRPAAHIQDSAARLRLRIGARTAAGLIGARALGAQEERARFGSLVSDAVGHPLLLREQDTAALQFLGMFRFCSREARGPSVLAEAMEAIDPGCPQARLLLRLADEWTAVTSLDGLPWLVESWKFLGGALGALRLPYRMRCALIWAATDQRLTAPAAHTENPWHDFLRLAGHNTARGQLPPWMLHLDLCAEHLGSAVKDELLAQNRKVAQSIGLDVAEQLDAERARNQQSPPAPVPRRRKYLAIHIAPDPLDSELYTVSHSFLSDAREEPGRSGAHAQHLEPGEALLQVPIDRLEGVVSTIVRQAKRFKPVEQARDGKATQPLRLEFVLPFELLNLPVDWWPRDLGEVPQVPLAADHPVVVRSLDRLQNSAWHQFWWDRWKQLGADDHPSRSVYVRQVHEHDDPLPELDERLDNERLVAMVLSEPPLPDRGHGHRELQAALRKGLPVVIWHRAGWSTSEFHEVLDGLLADGLRRFPAKVAAYRREAAQQHPDDEPADHMGRHLTVLWDNPRRRPVVPGLPWPSTVGP
ncbi:hypothetical protein RB628_09820 [Streptomyces sp. ADMS]|uniref:VMAP-C domain-containing protein n=1 Tax=Streptomyces sp. ADMS TaxID=3071415 RepID=UPI00296E5FFA|nr:hypothetical protein [Streptomyces sp. ADMS]MDW4905633.1 hypothetical protein [Streptomyces sp. ADMS]